MPIIPLKCPNCGAALQANSDDSILVCNFCNTQSVMKDAIMNTYVTNNITINTDSVNLVNEPKKEFDIKWGELQYYRGESLDVVIPDNVTKLGLAFKGLKIKSVQIPNSVTEIAPEAFSCCKELKSVSFPDSVREIGRQVCTDCESLTSVSIPSSVKKIGRTAFRGCRNLSHVDFSAQVEKIEDWLFYDCESLTTINIPSGVQVIGAYAFENAGLTEIVLPNTIKRIDRHAFCGCKKLRKITIEKPISKVEIGDGAFSLCSSLEEFDAPEDALVFDPSCGDNVYFKEAFQYCPILLGKREAKFREIRMSAGRCQFCGGEFKGVFRKVCKECGKEKNY